MRRSVRRYTPRRPKPLPEGVDPITELRQRRTALRRLILQTLPVDSPAFERHQERLARAGADLGARVAAYEQTAARLT